MNLKIFPTLVGYTVNFLNTKECSSFIKKIKKVKKFTHPYLTGKAESSHNTNSNLKIDTNLKNKITQKINQYAIDYGVPKLKISNSWVNIQSKKSILEKHTHPNSIVSGVLYLKVDKDSSPLHFYNPNPFLNYTSRKEITENNTSSYFIMPSVGSLLLFPSWLSHGFEKLNNSKERIAFSFNTNLFN